MAVIWAVLVGVVAAAEVFALLNDTPGDTFSEQVRAWARVHWARRVVVAGILVWLLVHWGIIGG